MDATTTPASHSEGLQVQLEDEEDTHVHDSSAFSEDTPIIVAEDSPPPSFEVNTSSHSIVDHPTTLD